MMQFRVRNNPLRIIYCLLHISLLCILDTVYRIQKTCTVDCRNTELCVTLPRIYHKPSVFPMLQFHEAAELLWCTNMFYAFISQNASNK